MTTVINTYEQNLNAIIEAEADANIEMLTKVQAEGGNIAQAMLEMNARQAQDAKAKGLFYGVRLHVYSVPWLSCLLLSSGK